MFRGRDRYEALNFQPMAGSIVKSTKKAKKFDGVPFKASLLIGKQYGIVLFTSLPNRLK